jgi:CRISPR/Cas system CSM-associated protein Csm3 (group 7 of RAMP superfamily)
VSAGAGPAGVSVSLRRRLQGTLVVLTPLHAGSGRAAVPGNLRAVAVDAAGQPFVPGSTLAGAMRHWYRRRAGAAAADAVFGSPQQGSALDAADAMLESGQAPGKVSRAGNAVDSFAAAGAPGSLRTTEIIPAGSRLTFDLTVHASRRDHPAFAALELLQVALEAGEITLGGGVSRGFGQVRAENCRLIDADLSTSAGLQAWLAGPADGLHGLVAGSRSGADGADGSPGQMVRIEIDWRPRNGVLVAADRRQLGADSAAEMITPLLEPNPAGPGWVPVLPGSAVKGSLRARAAVIARTLLAADYRLGDRAPNQLGDEPSLVGTAFGSTRQRGVVTFQDCRSRAVSGAAAAWPPPTASGDGGAAAARGTLGRPSSHVAIDRWTGSAAGDRSYRVLVPGSPGGWEPLRIGFDWSAHRFDSAHQRAAAFCLLGLVLAELSAGTLPLGARSARGLGAITVEAMAITGPVTLSSSAPVAESLLALLRRQAPPDWTHYLDAASGRQP